MPRLKIDDREYGLGADVTDTLPEDPQGYGPREVSPAEAAKLLTMLEAFGFSLVQEGLTVYVLEGSGRRVLTLGGTPLRVYATPVDVPAAPEQPQELPGSDVDITFPADPTPEPLPGVDVPFELVPIEEPIETIDSAFPSLTPKNPEEA